MHIQRSVRFLSHTLTVGLAAAIVLLLLLPESKQENPVVQMIEAQTAPVATGDSTGPGLGDGPVSYADAVSLAAPAVVSIHSTKQVSREGASRFHGQTFRDLFGDRFTPPPQRRETDLGSGVIVSPQGYILTNNHLIGDADQIQVALRDGRASAATVVGTDPETDLAVLKVQLPDLPSVTIGRSEALRVGDVVLAIGNPFGVGQTVTQGIVSATGRNNLDISTFENFIQTDAAINPGNSGGALVDAFGHLVGINTAIYSRTGGSQGIGFAIPVSLAKGVMREIIEKGRVSRGWVGIEIQELTPSLADSFGIPHAKGVVVAGVVREGPAHGAGVRPGDIITAVNGIDVEGGRDTLNAITGVAPGEKVKLAVLREGRREEVIVQAAERPAFGG